MRIRIAAFLMLITIYGVQAQNLAGKKIYEVGATAFFLNMDSTTLESDFNIRPNLGVTFITKKSFIHGISVREIWLKEKYFEGVNSGRYVYDTKIKETNISIKYEFGIPLTNNGSLLPYFSIGLIPEYTSYFSRPTNESTYDRHLRFYNLYTEINAHCLFILKQKYSLNLSGSIKINRFYRESIRIYNPNIRKNQQERGDNHNQWFPEVFEVKLSLGIIH
ncbi:hypothetical protein [Fulvivirga ligni]|uniref:hypothetical protein n=1 Tax=Fulvivirga ligni TaxID=2904246 RepID=UPI001F3BAEBA|nr:hypothetical protein [Fulvivirga ligni]UII20935.1 hypothetical protein LVD16_24125 [Fulvivirga ligni]